MLYHAGSLAATLLQQPLSKRLSAQCWESMTSLLWTGWPRKADCWWEWVHEGARPPQAVSMYFCQYSVLSPAHEAAHHEWHHFLRRIEKTAAQHIQLTFVLSAASMCFNYLLHFIKLRWYSSKKVWFVSAAKYVFMFSIVGLMDAVSRFYFV